MYLELLQSKATQYRESNLKSNLNTINDEGSIGNLKKSKNINIK